MVTKKEQVLGKDNQVGREWPLRVRRQYENSLSCGVALVALQRRDLNGV